MASDPKRLIVAGPSRLSGGGILDFNLRKAQHFDGYILSLESPKDARRLSIDVTPEALYMIGQWIAEQLQKRDPRRGA